MYVGWHLVRRMQMHSFAATEKSASMTQYIQPNKYVPQRKKCLASLLAANSLQGLSPQSHKPWTGTGEERPKVIHTLSYSKVLSSCNSWEVNGHFRNGVNETAQIVLLLWTPQNMWNTPQRVKTLVSLLICIFKKGRARSSKVRAESKIN